MRGRSRPDPATIEQARKALAAAAAVEDPFRRSLLALAIVSEAARTVSAEPVLVGGGALEWYTLGGYNTRDLDVVCHARCKRLFTGRRNGRSDTMAGGTL